MSPRPPEPPDRRRLPDRRSRPTSPFDSLRGYHRRRGPRRDGEVGLAHYSDRYSISMFTLSMMLLALTLVDGVLTLMLLEMGCEEVNPLMRYLLDHGSSIFLMGKYIITATCLPLMLILQNHRILRGPIRIRCLLPLFVMLYIWLLAYQFELFSRAQTEHLDFPELAASEM
jgi:hypothetical protein